MFDRQKNRNADLSIMSFHFLYCNYSVNNYLATSMGKYNGFTQRSNGYRGCFGIVNTI